MPKLFVAALALFSAVWAIYGFAMSSASEQHSSALAVSKIYSADGLFVAYILRDEKDPANNGHVWLKKVNSGDQWRLTSKPRPFVGLTFTPDGQSVTFLSREKGSDVIATFDVNFERGLASVYYNELKFAPGQVLAMPMWLDDDKLAYLSHTNDEGVSLMQWSSSRGNHEVLRRYTSNVLSF